MSRPLDDDALLRLLEQVWNPHDPLLLGFKNGRVRKLNAKGGLSLGFLNSTPISTFQGHINYPASFNSYLLIYGARYTYNTTERITYMLGRRGTKVIDDIDLSEAMHECHILLRKYMWTPLIKTLYHDRLKTRAIRASMESR